jgi:chemotaxis protein histidine kinase CheA
MTTCRWCKREFDGSFLDSYCSRKCEREEESHRDAERDRDEARRREERLDRERERDREREQEAQWRAEAEENELRRAAQERHDEAVEERERQQARQRAQLRDQTWRSLEEHYLTIKEGNELTDVDTFQFLALSPEYVGKLLAKFNDTKVKERIALLTKLYEAATKDLDSARIFEGRQRELKQAYASILEVVRRELPRRAEREQERQKAAERARIADEKARQEKLKQEAEAARAKADWEAGAPARAAKAAAEAKLAADEAAADSASTRAAVVGGLCGLVVGPVVGWRVGEDFLALVYTAMGLFLGPIIGVYGPRVVKVFPPSISKVLLNLCLLAIPYASWWYITRGGPPPKPSAPEVVEPAETPSPVEVSTSPLPNKTHATAPHAVPTGKIEPACCLVIQEKSARQNCQGMVSNFNLKPAGKNRASIVATVNSTGANCH